MSKKWFVVGIVAVFMVSAGVAWLIAAPSIGAAAATPAYVVVNTPTSVLFTAQISDPSVIPTGVNLLQVDASGKAIRILGPLRDDGTNGDTVANDRVFTHADRVIAASEGYLYYQISAAFRGALRRVVSPIIVVDISRQYQSSALAVAVDLPPNWRADEVDGRVNLLSPELQKVQHEPDAHPANVTIIRLSNDAGLNLDEFVNAHSRGWYTHYATRSPLTVAGQAAIRFSDVTSSHPHNPLEAVFVADSQSVLLITHSPEALSPTANRHFELVLSSLSF